MKKKKVLQLISILLALILSGSLIVVGVLSFSKDSFGWFAKNKRVNSNGNGVSIQSEDNINVVETRIYKYDMESNIYVESTDTADLKLNEFDTVFTERQAYTPVIVKIPLEMTKGTPFDITFQVKAGTDTTGSTLLGNISNLVRVRCCISSDLDADLATNGTAAESVYNIIKDAMEEESHPSANPITDGTVCEKGFVTYTGTGSLISVSQKSGSFSFRIGTHTVDDTTKQLNVYLMLDYDANLIAKYVSETESSSDSIFSGENTIQFSADIDSITFSKSAE